MTQPRKEQVKNLKTKYTRFTGVGTLAIGGGPVQSVSNTVLEAFYDNLLSVTGTGAIGGAETSAPAILYGGGGPYALAAGQSFTLAISGLNGDAPMLVAVQAGDVVTLGGSPVVTTSRMADRINQVCAGYGATAAVAANVNGQLVLTSATASGVAVGSSVTMTATEVTAGILNVLGFSLSGAATATGTTAPKRGVITVSADGLGGTVQLRKIDASVPDAVNSVVRHTLAGENVPDYGHGQPAYARLQAFPGPVINGRNLRFSFFRNGPVRPQVVTSQGADKSNFATLTSGDSVAVALDFGNGLTLNFSVIFSGITTVQSVVNKFNTAFSTASLAATGGQVDSTLPHVIFKMATPYRFTDPTVSDSFFVSLNGLAPIHINPPVDRRTSGEVKKYIDDLIVAAYPGTEGHAFTYVDSHGNKRIGIRSSNTDTSVSQVRVYPGNPGGSVPGTFMGTLDMLGITPGVYKAGTVAELYGLDEVNLHCPSSLPGASLTITGSALTMAKLGLPASVVVSSANGVQPVVAPSSHALIPEMVEFHEERDDYDSVVQDFDNKSAYAGLKPQDGVANVGLDQLLGPDGKLDASLIPKVLSLLGVDRLVLGSRMLNDKTNSLLTPKISASHPFDAAGYANLLFESLVDSPDVNDAANLRVYTSQGDIFILQNCVIQDNLGSLTAFRRDVNTLGPIARDSSMIWISTFDGIVRHSYRRSTDASPWAIADWKTTVESDPKGSSPEGNLLTLGQNLNANSVEANKSRIGTPVTADQYTLIYSGKASNQGRGNVRVYLMVGGAFAQESRLVVTVNAVLDNFNIWSKDVNGVDASFYGFGNQYFRVQTRTLDTTWSDDDWLEQQLWNLSNASGNEIQGTLAIGDSVTAPGTPRIKVNRVNPNLNRRVLLFESPINGGFAQVPIRIYLDTGSSVLSDGFTFTYNARWDQALDKWVQDAGLYASYALALHNPHLYLFRKNSGSANWSEAVSSWNSYDALNMTPGQEGYLVKDGTFRVDRQGTNIAGATAPLTNATYAKSMIKSWGKVKGDGPFTNNISLMDGFNCNFTGYDGGAGAYANYFATSMLDTNYAVLFSGRASNYSYPTPPTEPGSYFVWSGSRLHLYSAVLIGQATYGYSYYPLTGANGVPTSGLGDIRGYFMYFVVVGAQ